MTLTAADGIVSRTSNYSVDETVSRLKALLDQKGITLFAFIDHSGEAEKVGLQMRPTKLLVFGSPRAGTPVMLAAPTIAIDLPLKVLIWEDNQGQPWICWNAPDYLRERHNLPPELMENLAAAGALAAQAAA